MPEKANPVSLGVTFELFYKSEDCFKRVLADRYDADNNVDYHLFDKVPPTDQQQLIEKLTTTERNKSISGNCVVD